MARQCLYICKSVFSLYNSIRDNSNLLVSNFAESALHFTAKLFKKWRDLLYVLSLLDSDFCYMWSLVFKGFIVHIILVGLESVIEKKRM